MAAARPVFTPKTLSFLRALKRHNDRAWFHERRADYDRHVHEPMLAVVEQLAIDFRSVAPELAAEPKISMFRPWRDTRFSADKSPLKTHVAATFPHRKLGRMRGAGLYVEVSPESVWIGGGLYAPDPATLYAVREHVAAHHQALRRLTAAAPFKARLGALYGAAVTRLPRGFAAGHPAAELIKQKQFLASREEAPAFATRPDFYDELLATFRALTPLLRFLNTPILALRRTLDRDPLVTSTSRRRDD